MSPVFYLSFRLVRNPSPRCTHGFFNLFVSPLFDFTRRKMRGEGKKVKVKVGGVSDMEITEAAKTWDKCQFWLEKKRRFCRLQKMTGGHLFCGEHLPKKPVIVGTKEMERIPCPLNPLHTCFRHLVDKHVAKCMKASEQEEASYLEEDVNFFIEPSAWIQHYHSGIVRRSPYIKESLETGYDIPLSLADLSDQEYSDLVCKIIRVHEKGRLSPKNDFGIHPSVARELCRSDIGDSAAKHLTQIGSLLYLIENSGFLVDNTVFIEYGGGRGAITYHLATLAAEKGLNNCRFVVVDKASPRHKWDNKLGDLGIQVSRIKADIKDLMVGELPDVQDESILNIVGVAKHLCGSATDLSIESLLNSSSNSEKVLGFVMATCCHHKCVYEQFLGTKYIKDYFGPGEFPVLTQLSSWATDGNDASRIDSGRTLTETARKFLEEREMSLKKPVGEMVKDIMDWARLTGLPLVASLNVVNFTDKTTTLENRALVAQCNRT